MGIFLLGLILRLGWINAYGLWDDEVLSIQTAHSGLSFIFTNRFGWIGTQTSWYYALIWLVSQPLDPAISSVFVRLPSALAGIFLPLVVYGLGRELFSRTAGLIAAFMVALSPVMLDYAHDVRPYSLLALLTTASLYCLIMAERTGKAGWWVGFTITSVAGLLNAYVALTLALPALAVYLAWAFWQAWARRRQQGQGRNLLFLSISSAILILVGSVMLLEVTRVPRTPVDWSKFSIRSLADLPVNLLMWFTSLGITGSLTSVISFGLLLIAIVGIYAGVRQGHGRGVSICILYCLVPSFILAVLATTNLVYQRYALFAGPLYFLLIGNAVASVWDAGSIQRKNQSATRFLKAGGAVLVGIIFLAFSLGAFNYINPSTHSTISYRPDFRGAADYLSKKAGPKDLIIFADDPRLGYNVADFYWHGQPPAQAYDVRDPLLFRQSTDGNVYWVISSLDTQLVDGISNAREGWLDVVKFENVVVLKESASDRKTDIIVEQMADRLDALRPNYQPTVTMRAGVLQARGDVAGAARLFRAAGTYFALGDEALRTAEGFAGLGMDTEAWREGLNAKAAEPNRPDIHIWLAQQLQHEGYDKESQVETSIAGILQSDAIVGSR